WVRGAGDPEQRLFQLVRLGDADVSAGSGRRRRNCGLSSGALLPEALEDIEVRTALLVVRHPRLLKLHDTPRAPCGLILERFTHEPSDVFARGRGPALCHEIGKILGKSARRTVALGSTVGERLRDDPVELRRDLPPTQRDTKAAPQRRELARPRG